MVAVVTRCRYVSFVWSVVNMMMRIIIIMVIMIIMIMIMIIVMIIIIYNTSK